MIPNRWECLWTCVRCNILCLLKANDTFGVFDKEKFLVKKQHCFMTLHCWFIHGGKSLGEMYWGYKKIGMCSWGYWFVWEVVVLWPSYAEERLEMACLPFSLGLTCLVCFPKDDYLFKIIAVQFFIWTLKKVKWIFI